MIDKQSLFSEALIQRDWWHTDGTIEQLIADMLVCCICSTGHLGAYPYNLDSIHEMCEILKEEMNDPFLNTLLGQLRRSATVPEIVDVWFAGLNHFDLGRFDGAMCDRIFRMWKNED